MSSLINPKFISSAMATDAELDAASTADRNRANHTGTQAASTISDFDAAADARVAIGVSNHEAATDPHPQYTTNIESIVKAIIFG